MKLTLSWLKDHLDTDATLDEIVERLTSIGLEVEHVDDKAGLKPFVIAKVLTAVQHPDADRLRVLTVDTGNGAAPVQVVCGAPNARAGLIGAFAAPGAYVPGIDVTLTVGKIRGVESHGMMCSERELELSDEHNGIIDLPADAPVGTSFAAYAHLDDPVIEINLTPNRPDATSIYGVARDLAASGLGRLKTAPVEAVLGKGETPVKVTIEAPELCPGFALRLVKGVKNGPSPKWLQQRLIAIGLRPISALVDITNYVTFDRGRPLHVFDAKKVAGNLVVRRARDGEKVLALDGREYTLTPQMCVIADDNGVESIAGVMGGEHSGCDENTTDVLIESALWDPITTARTGRTLGIITDARYRFERGVDPEFIVPGVELATKLVLEFCGGEPTETEVVGYAGYKPKIVSFPISEVKRLTGIEVPKAESLDILTRLGFKPSGSGDVVDVAVPSWRPDVDGKADLVEEVMRIHGVDNIAPQPLGAHDAVNSKILTTLQVRTRTAKRSLAVRGMLEVLTWSFIPAKHAELFGGGQTALKLANPIAADMSDMRPSLLPGLIVAAQRNADKGIGDVALFEVSGTYEGDGPDQQRRVAAGVRRGTAKLDGSGRSWAGNSGPVGVFDAKADAIAALEACGAPVDRLQIEPGGPAWYHPGRSGTIKLGPKTVLGTFGEFHPKTLEGLDVSGPICGFEVYIDAVPEPKAKPTKTKPKLELSAFQAVKRDFAFVVDKTVEAGALVRAALAADKKLVTGVSVFDVFEGASLGTAKKSIAIEVSIQPVEKTLTDEDFEALAKRIVDNVGKQTGGMLRT
ncbi:MULTISPECIES: phenylalanine--tRNA ligase subunit beta [unclassified Mesorhizobium]|uniref:phenylalanine--tRNA ligase subunit beta n=1 Tax=unclassified Mesorhizobium TaxID=325217 RepID=UPI0003CE3DA9|nr:MULTISPECIES: phenylalanine--tRNA ligase subunit beta [unclassified Mesorhizobium]ESX22050.1 phenylalanyl-tRNA synthetase subunit beta [Mesorhizobium sp. LSJC255A00]ESX30287.1 phenylalanyl-tRNA synthetase subunit beta [Mesorhizobium sp. LSHC440B00]ESX36919.1 phenylalanyl-tRNA synthetase subunit beta [Mesorhizobium sp. LSHC432A00]ESX40924.1 phenylalanyl-tRNA synthetase subunit beta [Mesorhizobium sp. LSHC440A00]ESX77502.1 phenylalanyl-tRNA synthetase subunit beta [Mesorhizobium sp. LSHC414A0